MYREYAHMKNWQFEELAISDSEVGGYRVMSSVSPSLFLFIPGS